MEGILINTESRPDIALDDGRLWGGLHCGECFSCLFTDAWVPARLEFQDDWILIIEDHMMPIPFGVRVRI